ncbi:unnamed protein product, partial [Iphiclides podalirius]
MMDDLEADWAALIDMEDEVVKEIRALNAENCEEIAPDRARWRQLVSQAKTHFGSQSQRNVGNSYTRRRNYDACPKNRKPLQSQCVCDND